MKRKKKNKLAYLFFLAGIAVIIFPFLKQTSEEYRQKQMLKSWKQSMLELDTTSTEEGQRSENSSALLTETDKEIIGVLKIDAIDLELPILKGATAENLRYSAAAIEPAIEAGKIGNLAIAAHNSRTYGRHFNRLNEVKEDDLIKVEQENRIYVYSVDKIQIISAEDIWILEEQAEKVSSRC